jgi:hypothetical protein
MTEAVVAQTDPPAPPSTPADAAAKLVSLKADPKWTAALLQGQRAQTAEFHSLHELAGRGDSTDIAMAGALQPGIIQNSEHLQNIGAAEMLRDLGMPADVIKETLSGKTAVTQEFYDKIAGWKKNAMTDSEWSKRLLSGDGKARSQLTLANIILTGGIKEQA